VKIIVFDFDGVIADTFSFCYRIINERDSITPAEYRSRFEGNINTAPKAPGRSGAAFDFFSRYTPELMASQPDEKMVSVIRILAREHTLIIVSSTITSAISAFLDLHGLRNVFAEILGNDVDRSKVKKLRDVIRRYDIDPSETIFITDTLGDIREATECGVRSIAVTWGYHSAETLQKGEPYQIVDIPSKLLETVEAANCRRVSKEAVPADSVE
jgi:phosphoglycolate phosphatase